MSHYFLPFICAVMISVPVFSAEPAGKWTALFDRNEIWLGADGIYSIPLDGNDAWGTADEKSKTLFVFSDSMVGTADAKTHEYKDAKMVNHSAALLEGNEPEPEKIRFVYGKQGDMSRSNLFGILCWLQDGIVLDNTVYLTGFLPDQSWKPKRLDLFAVPLTPDNIPDWQHFQQTENFPLLIRDDRFLVCYGIGILDQSARDGFIYVYGYRDDLKTHEKHLLVARVVPKSFADAANWQFWNGKNWTPGIRETLNPEASLAGRVSTELSVTPLDDGRFLLVYIQDVMSSRLTYRLGTSPLGPFGKPVFFYDAPEPVTLGKGIYVYNAKAHPHLSAPGKLLISYNVNRLGSLPHKTSEYRPRFVELRLDELGK